MHLKNNHESAVLQNEKLTFRQGWQLLIEFEIFFLFYFIFSCNNKLAFISYTFLANNKKKKLHFTTQSLLYH